MKLIGMKELADRLKGVPILSTDVLHFDSLLAQNQILDQEEIPNFHLSLCLIQLTNACMYHHHKLTGNNSLAEKSHQIQPGQLRSCIRRPAAHASRSPAPRQ